MLDGFGGAARVEGAGKDKIGEAAASLYRAEGSGLAEKQQETQIAHRSGMLMHNSKSGRRAGLLGPQSSKGAWCLARLDTPSIG